MDIQAAKNFQLDSLRDSFRSYLRTKGYNENTVGTMGTDSFYLLRKEGADIFWNVMASDDFENAARTAMLESLSAHSKGNPHSLVNGYLTSMRRLREFLELPISVPQKSDLKAMGKKTTRKNTVILPTPCVEQIEYYLQRWDSLENYHLQEDALDKLFIDLCPENNDLSDILIKVSTLNDFYSTNIFSVYPVAKHIRSLNIDDRLQAGDVALVNDVMRVMIDGKQKNFYSFATKYCSHHNPLSYPIYDSYVEKVLIYFRDKDGFSVFATPELKDYTKFKSILIEFGKFYGLEQYNLKQIDKYIWQLGKEYFPKNFSKKTKEQ